MEKAIDESLREPSPPEMPPEKPRSLPPLLVLMLVPLAWGTYGPSIKSLYSLDAPPPELLFSVLNYVVSASSLAVISAVRALLRTGEATGEAEASSQANPEAGENGLEVGEKELEVGDQGLQPSADMPPGWASGLPLGDDWRTTLAGFELGSYLFVGSTIQIFGIQYTTAGRAAFIVQLTTVIVPLLEAALTRTAPAR